MPTSHDLSNLSDSLLVLQSEVEGLHTESVHFHPWVNLYATSEDASLPLRTSWNTLKQAIKDWSIDNEDAILAKSEESGMTLRLFEEWVGNKLGNVAESTLDPDVDVRVLTEAQVTRLERTHQVHE
jgi:hypothetical protein